MNPSILLLTLVCLTSFKAILPTQSNSNYISKPPTMSPEASRLLRYITQHIYCENMTLHLQKNSIVQAHANPASQCTSISCIIGAEISDKKIIAIVKELVSRLAKEITHLTLLISKMPANYIKKNNIDKINEIKESCAQIPQNINRSNILENLKTIMNLLIGESKREDQEQSSDSIMQYVEQCQNNIRVCTNSDDSKDLTIVKKLEEFKNYITQNYEILQHLTTNILQLPHIKTKTESIQDF